MLFLSCTTLWSSSSLASFGVWLNFLCTYQWWNPQLLTNFIFLINFIHSFRTCSNLVWSPPHAGFSRPSVQSVSQFTRSIMSDSLWPHESQYARPPCSSPTPRVHSNTRPSSRWRHPAISSSVIPSSSYPQSLPASESFSNESTLRMRWRQGQSSSEPPGNAVRQTDSRSLPTLPDPMQRQDSISRKPDQD